MFSFLFVLGMEARPHICQESALPTSYIPSPLCVLLSYPILSAVCTEELQ